MANTYFLSTQGIEADDGDFTIRLKAKTMKDAIKEAIEEHDVQEFTSYNPMILEASKVNYLKSMLEKQKQEFERK
jgi:hypothetical protein